MKCRGCNKVEVPSYRTSHKPLILEEMEDRAYCTDCWKIVKFKRVRYVKRPYKIPIDRRIG